MSENKELKKGNGQEPETETTEEGVEGYAYCDSHKASCGSRVHIVLKGKLYKFYKKLDDVEKEISVNYSIPFIRIHKSYLVNFQQIRKVGYTEVETKDGRILNISDTYKKDVRARYSKLLWDGDV